jgi:hypothetical protein
MNSNLNVPINRATFFILGVILFILKHNIDRFVATLNGRPWGLLNYLTPVERAVTIRSLTPADRTFFGILMLVALPFITAGVVLTIRRLRTLGWPAWLVVFFFIPFVNALFFLVLSVANSEVDTPAPARARRGPGRWIPENAFGSALLSLGITVPVGILMTMLGVTVLSHYGWGLFVAIPFSVGLGAALIHSYRRPRTAWECISVGMGANLLLGVGILAVAFEGLVCLLMAAPLALALGALGGAAGYFIQRQPREHAPAMLALVALFSPGWMFTEHLFPREAPTLKVVTPIEVDAPPERVWQNVVSFSELPPPVEPIFRAGIAFPIRARIDGSGVGAVRKCEFSTGPFVEPIQVWDEPRLLRFSVTANPQPMQEWTPYRHIEPPHLNGYLASRQGQFLLTPLPGGRTLLEGTTWYQHHLWPAPYWQFWSDAIIHRIHLRVLQHVKRLSEAPAGRM